MGCSDLMPGISGGTIALILCVYKKLIHLLTDTFTSKSDAVAFVNG